jgi:ankyrin repeat protein
MSDKKTLPPPKDLLEALEPRRLIGGFEPPPEGLLEQIRNLIQKGADVNQKDHLGRTPLFLVTNDEHLDILKLLIEHGADPYHKDKENRSILHYCTRLKTIKTAQYYLDNFNLNINAQDNEGLTPLMSCVRSLPMQSNMAGILQVYIDHGADINVLSQGHDALAWAISNNHHDCALALLKAGATFQLYAGGTTALHMAAQNKNLVLIQELVQRGQSLSTYNDQGYTPFHSLFGPWKKYKEKLDCVDNFLEQGADINQRTKEGLSPLEIECAKGDPRMIEKLLELGADIHPAGPRSGSALGSAAYSRMETVVQKLLELGADARALNSAGQTALMQAMLSRGKEDKKLISIISMLIDHGVDVNATFMGNTVMDWIEKKPAHYPEVGELVSIALEKG